MGKDCQDGYAEEEEDERGGGREGAGETSYETIPLPPHTGLLGGLVTTGLLQTVVYIQLSLLHC